MSSFSSLIPNDRSVGCRIEFLVFERSEKNSLLFVVVKQGDKLAAVPVCKGSHYQRDHWWDSQRHRFLNLLWNFRNEITQILKR